MKKTLKKGKALSKPQGKKLSKPPSKKSNHAAERAARLAKNAAPVKVIRSSVEPPQQIKKGKPLKKAEPKWKDAAPKSGPTPEVPKNWKWKGKKSVYPLHKKAGFILVKPEDMPPSFPKLSQVCPPNSFWRVHPKEDHTPSLVTILPNDITTGWDSCSRCMNHATRCICSGGIVHPRGLEWVFITATLDKENVDYPGRLTGKVDVTLQQVRDRALFHYKGRSASYVPPANKLREPLSLPKSGKAVEPVSVPAKKVLSKKKQADVSSLDMKKLSSDAAKASNKAEDALMRKLNKPAKKTLSKKGKK